jgi:hypothetical protein
MTNNQDQISRTLEPVKGESSHVPDDMAPLMPFPTSYVLDKDQENELISHLMTRLDELEAETGRNVCSGRNFWDNADSNGFDPKGIESASSSWMGRRLRYEMTFNNDVSWRPGTVGGVFTEYNLVVPVSRRITRQMVARAVNYYFGTSPWFSIYPVGRLDKSKADKGDRFMRHIMDKSNLQRTMEQAVERAFILGECVVKTSWEQRETVYETTATVLVDAAGNDILDAFSDYIEIGDEWVQDSAVDPTTGQPIMSDLILLKRDGKTPQPAEIIWQEKKITRMMSHYKGPESKPIHYMDFLAPLTSPTIQDADCCVHLYDMDLMALADRFKKSAASKETTGERVEATRKATELLRRLSTGSSETSGQNNGAFDQSMKGEFSRKTIPTIKVAEFNVTYDIDGRGLRNITFILDRESRTPIFYDYDANLTADGLRPYSCVRVNEIPGRWTGLGAMEMFDPSQQIVDFLINKKALAASKAGRIDFGKPHNTLQGRSNPDFELSYGGHYTPIGDKTAKDCFESIYLENNVGDDLMTMVEFFMQLMMNESGISSANDNNTIGLDMVKTATGVKNIEKSGQELFSLFLGHLQPGITDCLSKMIKLAFSRINDLPVYQYFEEGESMIDPLTGQIIEGEGVGSMVEISQGDISQAETDVQVLLTKYKGEQTVASNTAAIDLALRFFDPMMTIEMQQRLAPLFAGTMKEYQVPNADQMMRPLAQPMQGNAPPGASPAEAASVVKPKPRKGETNL